jgi:vacuolar-type H+-ATPase subunit H
MAKGVQEEPGQESRQALSTLLATEEQLDARLTAAREEAQRIVAEGIEEARRTLEGAPALIEARSAALAAEIEAQLQRDLAAIEQSAADAIARYEAVDPDRSPDLVTLVVSRVLETGRTADHEVSR